MEVVKGTIAAVAGNKKGFMVNGTEGWFNASDEKLLEGYTKGDNVEVYYEISGKSKKVSKIVKAGAKTAVSEPTPKEKTEFACAICGKELKDGKYTKCYECNTKAKTTPETKEKAPAATTDTSEFKCTDCGKALKDDKYEKCFVCNQTNPDKKQWNGKSKGSYVDSPEKINQIQKGNSLNAAATVLCGSTLLDGLGAEGVAEVTRVVAHLLHEYLKQD